MNQVDMTEQKRFNHIVLCSGIPVQQTIGWRHDEVQGNQRRRVLGRKSMGMGDRIQKGVSMNPCPLCKSAQVQLCSDSNNPQKDLCKCRECGCAAPRIAWDAIQPTQERAVPDGFKLLKNSTQEERSFPEDASAENGNYFNNCCNCGRIFIGYKRRVICKVCTQKPVLSKDQDAQQIERSNI